MNDRAWIAKRWVKYLKRAAEAAEEDLAIAIVVPSHDDPTRNAVQEACLSNKIEVFLDIVDEQVRDDSRVWNQGRYDHMAMLRNRLLDMVRLLEPKYFLSVDSDILVARDSISQMISDLDRFDAVAGKVWLHPSHKDIVNWANLKRGEGSGIRRKNSVGCFEVDCIMALKLMTKEAYWVDYYGHSQGEDFGWSENARAKGLKLGWDGSVPSKHIMSPQLLDQIDRRLGW